MVLLHKLSISLSHDNIDFCKLKYSLKLIYFNTYKSVLFHNILFYLVAILFWLYSAFTSETNLVQNLMITIFLFDIGSPLDRVNNSAYIQ